jgi:flagellar protein FlgJ
MTSLASSIPSMSVAQMPQQNIKPQMTNNLKKVHQAAVKFEGMFMNEMLSQMFEGVNSADNPMGGGHGEEVFRSMLTEQYGTIVSESGQTGLSKQIEKEMLKMQEEQANPHGPGGKLASKTVDQSSVQASGTDNAS